MRPDSFTLSGPKDVNSIGMECFNSLCALRSEKSTLHVHVMLFTDWNKNSRSVLFELLFCGFIVQNLQVRNIKRFISSQCFYSEISYQISICKSLCLTT